jgi:hypothetical protein
MVGRREVGMGGGASHVAVAVSEERQELVDDGAGYLMTPMSARSRSPTRVSASSPSIAEGVVILARVKLGWRFAQHAY